MEITKVEPQVNNNDRFNVYIDNKYSFSLTADQLIDNPQIKSGYKILQSEVDKLKCEYDNFLAFSYVLYQLSYSQKTEKQMRDKFKRKGKYTDESINYAIEKAKSLDLINDYEYCKNYIEYCLSQKLGQYKIQQKLFQKGISKDIYEPLVVELLRDENKQLQDAIERCQNYNKQIKVLDIYKRKNKLYRYLANKGFPSEIIKEAIQKVLDNNF